MRECCRTRPHTRNLSAGRAVNNLGCHRGRQLRRRRRRVRVHCPARRVGRAAGRHRRLSLGDEIGDCLFAGALCTLALEALLPHCLEVDIVVVVVALLPARREERVELLFLVGSHGFSSSR